MASSRTAFVDVDLAHLGMMADATPIEVQAADLIEALREQFDAQGEIAPPDAHLLALGRVATGFLRTSPLAGDGTADGRRDVLRSFVATALGWWTRDHADDRGIDTLLHDVFHQRETPVPDAAAMELLVTVAAGLLRRRRIPPHAAGPRLAIADWLASLYLAGLDDW
jgi:hypothetical protein